MENGITAYFQCARCVQECPSYMSMAEFARFNVGSTAYGIQIWCVRHNMNIYHLDVVSEPSPGCVTHGEHTGIPFAADLSLACPRCGFDPASGQAPTPLDDAPPAPLH